MRCAAFLFALTLIGCEAGMAAQTNLARQAAANRPRRIIFNNDGNEPVYYCKAATAGELLHSRTTGLAGTQVDAIFYCTWSSGFGMFTHHTKVGQLFTTREEMFAPNRTREFFEQGIDPLRVMVEFGHQHNLEVFWSMRMNDTHDGSTAAYGPVMLRANKLKQEHPEYLMGTKTERPKYGSWTAVNYAVPEVRELAFKYCEEVCRNYDVDGIELDFFRHAFFFKSSGSNQPCTATELDQMTSLIRRIRLMTEAIGSKRKRPILVAMRMPDSVAYARFIGLDLEGWLAEGLLDLMIVGGYVNLNPWETSAALGHKYGVKVYPSLDESRVKDEAARQLRTSIETYRGRAASAWAAGMDGIYVFNLFDPASRVWRELGDAQGLQPLDKDYFLSVLGRGAVPVPHDRFQNLPTLNPAIAIPLRADKPIEFVFRTGEDARDEIAGRKVMLRLQFAGEPPVDALRVSLNKVVLPAAARETNWAQFAVDQNILQRRNSVRIATTGSPAQLTDAMLSVRFPKPARSN